MPSIGQCEYVAGPSGMIWNGSHTGFVQFTIALDGGASFYPFNDGWNCDLYCPSISIPWSGNSPDSILSLITYTFSEPINSVTVFVGGTAVGFGIPIALARESFTFETNTVIPHVSVDPGSCNPWVINGNTTTNPADTGAFNSYQTVQADVPFTTLRISTYGTATNGGSSFAICSGSIQLATETLQHFLGPDTTICSGQTMDLNVDFPNTTCLWDDGSTDPVRTITGAGAYWAQLYLNGSIFIGTDTIHLASVESPHIDLGPDTAICPDGTLLLDPGFIPGAWLWSTGSNAYQISVAPPQEVWLTVLHDGCVATDTVRVALDDCDPTVIVPNIFTPNADGVNDRFIPSRDYPDLPLRLTVRNRYGQVIYDETGATLKGWDGRTSSGEPCSTGTYFWTLQTTMQADFTYKAGVVTLLR